MIRVVDGTVGLDDILGKMEGQHVAIGEGYQFQRTWLEGQNGTAFADFVSELFNASMKDRSELLQSLAQQVLRGHLLLAAVTS